MIYNKIMKRIFDIIISLLGLAVVFPIMIVIFLLVKASSKGPAIFKQKRVGINNKHFNILKFRTMYVDAPSEVPTDKLPNTNGMITPIGRFLRKTSLDELPQLVNVLVGDMSLVGPRPALWNQYQLIELRNNNGSSRIRPGITGLAQISGRDNIEETEKARLDGVYTDMITFKMDLKCIFMTFFKVFIFEGVNDKVERESTL